MTQPLATLTAGQTATIRGFSQDNSVTQRLLQLGIIEGERVDVVRRAPAGDPIEIRILGYSLSLRNTEAEIILVTLA
ncbi:MAG TPA: ferrous iron transport protein A [Gammaproteobacteria bacterium]|nr:ferrous iron transport protein A [Gammaproteobacteria bacterium]|tara:strand:- start:780 stop:1010 length:231 start_codon:yes stop_codon:yes gene_type:complete